jgi:hypothetical protein
LRAPAIIDLVSQLLVRFSRSGGTVYRPSFKSLLAFARRPLMIERAVGQNDFGRFGSERGLLDHAASPSTRRLWSPETKKADVAEHP